MKMDFLLKVSQFLKCSLPCMRAQDFKFTKLKIIQLPEKSDLQTGWKGGKKEEERREEQKWSSASYIYSKPKMFVPQIHFHQFSLLLKKSFLLFA